MVLHRDRLYIYAGKNLKRSFSDLWEFEIETAKFRRVAMRNEPKEDRSGHIAVMYKENMLVFGGITSVTHERDDLLSYSFETGEWRTIWENSEEKCGMLQVEKKKVPHKKLSNVNQKCLENAVFQSKYESHSPEQIGKYRRPLAEEKQTKVKIRFNYETKRSKKEKQRKIMLINDIEAEQNNCPHTEKYSPLIESLTNSIMLTSSIIHTTPAPSRERHRQGA
jgi:hypothetical protein